MEASIEKTAFAATLGRVTGVINHHSTMPILGHIYGEAQGDHLTLCGTDLEVFLRETVPAQVVVPGRFVLPGRELAKIVKAANSETVSLKNGGADRKAVITDRNGKFSLYGIEPGDFPLLQESSKPAPPVADIQGDILANLIERTAYAVSRDTADLKGLSGILFNLVYREGHPYLRLVATDGYRMAVRQVLVDDSVTVPKGGVVVPRDGALQIRKLAASTGEDTLQVSFTESECRVSAGETLLAVRVLQAKYPDYRRVIPLGKGETPITADREALIETVSRMLIASENVMFSVEGDILVLSGGDQWSTAKEELAVGYAGEPMEVAFNGRYMVEALKSFSSEEVTLDLRDEGPSVIRGIDADEGALALVMRVLGS